MHYVDCLQALCYSSPPPHFRSPTRTPTNSNPGLHWTLWFASSSIPTRGIIQSKTVFRNSKARADSWSTINSTENADVAIRLHSRLSRNRISRIHARAMCLTTHCESVYRLCQIYYYIPYIYIWSTRDRFTACAHVYQHAYGTRYENNQG